MRITLSNADVSTVVRHSSAWLTDGFHEAEEAHRWTDGDAALPAKFWAGFDGEITIEMELLDQRLTYQRYEAPLRTLTEQAA